MDGRGGIRRRGYQEEVVEGGECGGRRGYTKDGVEGRGCIRRWNT